MKYNNLEFRKTTQKILIRETNFKKIIEISKFVLFDVKSGNFFKKKL